MKTVLNLYWGFLFVMYVGGGAGFLDVVALGDIPAPFVFLALGVPIWFQFVLFPGRVFKMYVDNLGPLLPFSLLALLYIILGFNYLGSISQGNERALCAIYPAYSLTMLTSFAVIGYYYMSMADFQRYCKLALIVLMGTCLIQLLLPDFFEVARGGRQVVGMAGIGMNRNITAAKLVIICSVIIDYRTLGKRDFMWLSATTLVVLTTLSRGGLVVNAVLMAYYGWAVIKHGSGVSIFKQVTAAALLLATSIFLMHGLIGLETFASKDAIQRLNWFMNADAEMFQDNNRTELIIDTIDDIQRGPFWGYGPGYHNAKMLLGRQGPHNEYLKHALDSGIVAGLLYALFMIGGIWTFWKRRFPRGTVLVLVAATAALFSQTQTENTTVIILYGFLCGHSLLVTSGRTYHSAHHAIPNVRSWR